MRGMTPRLIVVAAVSADGFISKGAGVPWDLPADRAHFRACTQGKWLLLGRTTFEEMRGWFKDHHPLVLSRDAEFKPSIGECVDSVTEALRRAARARQQELVVCGGGQVYTAALPLADRLVITHVHQILGSGVPFPVISPRDWEPVSKTDHRLDAKHSFAFEIVIYQRVMQLQRAA